VRKMANPTSHRNFAPQHSRKMVAPRICNTFAMGNNATRVDGFILQRRLTRIEDW
jgi:hypothetical protein